MSENKTQYTNAVIPGDGIGKEVTPSAQQALQKAPGDAAHFTDEDFHLGAERYPRVKAGVLVRGLLLKLRFSLDQYLNLRPSKLY